MAFQNNAFQNNAFQIRRQDDEALYREWLLKEELEQRKKRARFRAQQQAESLALELYQQELEQLKQSEIDTIEMLITLLLIEESQDGYF